MPSIRTPCAVPVKRSERLFEKAAPQTPPQAAAHGTRATDSAKGSNGSAQTPSVFFLFLGEGLQGPVALVAGAAALCVLAERKQREQPLQAACGRFALALARRPAPAGRSRAARRGGGAGPRGGASYGQAGPSA